MPTIELYDTTLRDGAQGEGVNFSLEDKVLIARRLDELGFDYVEGGFPLSNPKDAEFFQRLQQEPLKHSKLCAFGMTRRRGMNAADDPGMQRACSIRQTPVITIVGKTRDFHVTEVLGVSLEENLAMIRDTVAYFREAGPRGDLRRRAFLRRLEGEPRLRRRKPLLPPPRRARRASSCATPTAARMPEEVARLASKAARGLATTFARSPLGHPHPQRLRSGGGQLAGRRRRRRHPSARHHQRPRRALRQRRLGRASPPT